MYSALRPGRDQFIVRVADGTTEDEATITLENEFPKRLGLGGPGDARPSRKRIVDLGGAHCPSFPFAVGSCRAAARARATIRQRGKPRRTVTIGRASLTLMPSQTKSLKVQLSKKFLRVLKQARQIKVTVFLTTEQHDPFGLWEAELKDRSRLYWYPLVDRTSWLSS